jgi:hypothetical protein
MLRSPRRRLEHIFLDRVINYIYPQGDAAFKNKDYLSARDWYSTAIQIDPSEYRCPLNKSIVNLKLERSEYRTLSAAQYADHLIGGLKRSKMLPRPSV